MWRMGPREGCVARAGAEAEMRNANLGLRAASTE